MDQGKTHYARYRSYYHKVIKTIDSTHRPLQEMLKFKGRSVQAQDKYVDTNHLVCYSSNRPVKKNNYGKPTAYTIRSSLKYI